MHYITDNYDVISVHRINHQNVEYLTDPMYLVRKSINKCSFDDILVQNVISLVQTSIIFALCKQFVCKVFSVRHGQTLDLKY